MSYTLVYRVGSEKAKSCLLRDVSKEEAMRQFDAMKTNILLAGQSGRVKLFDERYELIRIETILK
jgi:hypothetical protein